MDERARYIAGTHLPTGDPLRIRLVFGWLPVFRVRRVYCVLCRTRWKCSPAAWAHEHLRT